MSNSFKFHPTQFSRGGRKFFEAPPIRKATVFRALFKISLKPFEIK